MFGFGAPTPPAGSGTGSGPGVDDTARSLAAAAQADADAAQAAADSALSGAGHDATARAAASAAQASAAFALGGSANDSTARAVAATAQGDADALEALIALRASRMRVYLSVAQSISSANTPTRVNFDVTDYATGVYGGQSVSSYGVVIPAGVAKVRIRFGAQIGVGGSGGRVAQVRRYRGSDFVIVGDARVQAVSSGGSTAASSAAVIDVQSGDRLELWVTTSVASQVQVLAETPTNSTYVEVEVVA